MNINYEFSEDLSVAIPRSSYGSDILDFRGLFYPTNAIIHPPILMAKTKTPIWTNELCNCLFDKHCPFGIVRLDANFIVLGMNDRAKEIFKRYLAMKKKSLWDLFVEGGDDQSALRYKLQSKDSAKKFFKSQIIIHDLHYEAYFLPMVLPNRLENGFLCTLVDVSDSYAEQEKLNDSIKKKEVILQEAHHRIKNNFQLISSLLNLDSSSLHDAKALNVLHESRNRIMSLALLHQMLYQSPASEKVCLKDYFSSLANYMMDNYNSGSTHISLSIDCNDIYETAEIAIPCGLIVTELITNSLKYAFHGLTDGKISLSMKRIRNTYMLSVSDDGIGMKKTKVSANTMGFTIVRALADQLNGTIEARSQNGANITLSFPANEND